MRIAATAAFLLFASAVLSAQQASTQTTAAAIEEFDSQGFLRETQQMKSPKDYLGMVWWIPVEYWEKTAEEAGMSPELARKRYAPLRNYTMVVIAVGKTGIGTVNWSTEADIKSNVYLTDANGVKYKPLEKVDADASGLASIMKPIFANILGPMGQNLALFFFPAKDAKNRSISEPRLEGGFTVTLTSLLGTPETVFEWRLPLNTLSPPKYCPVGKERVEASWKYCPWHGNALK